MADYNELLTSIASVIKTNNRREITGQILQNVLSQMVGSLGENYQLAGFATPSYNPHQPDQNVFYVTDQAGQYSNFDNITLDDGLSFLLWKNEQWTSKTFGVATHQWVDNNYVSKAFFRQLFRPKDSLGNEILANDTASIVDNIQSMVGLWTERYLTALGYGADGGGAVRSLSQLDDVQLTTPLVNGDVLSYNTTLGKWTNINGSTLGTVRKIKLGDVTYDPVLGVVSLPAYPTVPTDISSFYNDSGYITSSGSCAYATSAGSATNATNAEYATSAGSASSASYASYASYLYALVADNDYIRIQGGSGGSNSGYLEIATADDGTEPIYVRQYTGVFSSITRTLTLLSSSGSTELPGDLYVNGGDFWLQETGGQPRMIFHIPNVTWGNLTLKSDGQFYFYQSNTDGSGATVNVGNLYATGAVTALSDERHKDIIGDTHLEVEQIAGVRSVLYRWDDGREDAGIYAGSIAQDWLGILPQVVTRAKNDEGTMSLQYGVAALIASITIARKVVDHEKRISELEAENERLRNEVEQLKAA